MAGDGFDKRLNEGVMKALADHPTYTKVGEVYGQWTATVAQKEVAGILLRIPTKSPGHSEIMSPGIPG